MSCKDNNTKMGVGDESAVILLSGGLDSATCLALARERNLICHCLTIDYGQRHRAELDNAAQLAQLIGAAQHKVVGVDLRAIGGSALTDDAIAVPEGGKQPGIPDTYVPARNTVFLSIALGWAEVLDARYIYLGINAVDYSGYPDCRPEFLAAYQAMANLATKCGVGGKTIGIEAPLLNLSKKAIVAEAKRLAVPVNATLSCYAPDANGQPCGKCDSCRIRNQAMGDFDPADCGI